MCVWGVLFLSVQEDSSVPGVGGHFLCIFWGEPQLEAF